MSSPVDPTNKTKASQPVHQPDNVGSFKQTTGNAKAIIENSRKEIKTDWSQRTVEHLSATDKPDQNAKMKGIFDKTPIVVDTKRIQPKNLNKP